MNTTMDRLLWLRNVLEVVAQFASEEESSWQPGVAFNGPDGASFEEASELLNDFQLPSVVSSLSDPYLCGQLAGLTRSMLAQKLVSFFKIHANAASAMAAIIITVIASNSTRRGIQEERRRFAAEAGNPEASKIPSRRAIASRGC
jgi:hypothetical protein